MKTVLSIAGSDCSGGAGLQADLKTITAFGVYGMTAITFLTAQNTTGIHGIFDVSNEFLKNQIDVCCNDISPNATKIGAVFDEQKIKIIIDRIKFYNLKNIVVDPVMVCTANGGITDCLLKPEAVDSMINDLFKIADIITPNIPEAEVIMQKITGNNIKIDSKEKMEFSAKEISKYVKNNCVLLKGGHFNDCSDCLFFENKIIWFEGKKVDTKNTHGTGCSLSSAIASNLALGFAITESCKIAKDYVYNAILNNPNLGKGNGPINHCWKINNKI